MSVQMIVFIPPLFVYTQIKKTEKITVISKGIDHFLKINSCKTIATKKSLNEAPKILETKKKKAPTY